MEFFLPAQRAVQRRTHDDAALRRQQHHRRRRSPAPAWSRIVPELNHQAQAQAQAAAVVAAAAAAVPRHRPDAIIDDHTRSGGVSSYSDGSVQMVHIVLSGGASRQRAGGVMMAQFEWFYRCVCGRGEVAGS